MLNNSTPSIIYPSLKTKALLMTQEAKTKDAISKTSIAKIHQVLWLSWKELDPYWSVVSGSHPDIFHVSSSRQPPTIDQIRAFSNELEYPPHQLEKKLFIIWRLDEASISAQNALLKQLEEPPKYTQIIITAQNPGWIVETIQSRVRTTMVELNLELEPKLERDDFENRDSKKAEDFKQFLDPKFWQSSTIGELSSLANTIKEKSEALIFLNQLANGFINHDRYPQPFMTIALEQIQQTYFSIKGNANVGLQLEHCFFKLKQL
jgi:hypothetical protein